MTVTVGVVGTSGAGKTTLVEGLAPALRARGLTVASVKHAHHGFELDREGSDSARHAAAGSDAVVLAGPDRHAVLLAGAPPLDTLVARHLGAADVVLVEGFTSQGGPKVLVHRRGLEPRAVADPQEVIVAVTDEPLGYPKEVAPGDVDAVADEVAALVHGSALPSVHLLVDGQPVPLAEFATRIVSTTVEGMVHALKGVPDEPHTIELTVRVR